MKQTLGLKDMPNFAEKFVGEVPVFDEKATVVGLYGNLGAGKTTFTQEVAKVLEVKETVTSPTFTLQSIYETNSDKFKKLVHIDFYRIEELDEVKILKLDELVQEPKTLILVEWMDKVEGELGEDFIKVKFGHKDDESREVEIEW
jgi:tRNA threonylcarbamoyladenosine biosynthesis protein TsaE